MYADRCDLLNVQPLQFAISKISDDSEKKYHAEA